MEGIVLDASATMPWCFEDEATRWTEALADRFSLGLQALVPSHWPIEVANALLIAQSRGRITGRQSEEFCEDLAALAILVEPGYPPTELPALIATAQRYRLTIYDVAYLELARRSGLRLATLDQRLQTAAWREGLPLLQ